MLKITTKKILKLSASLIVLLCFINFAHADSKTFGSVAANITKTFSDMGKMLTGLSYVAGLGFAIAAILKFKQHKDNPQQVPVGMPLGLLAVAAAFLFLPTLMGVTGQTLFGGGQRTAGPSGTTIQGSE